ncbi:MAG: OmpA family protein [Bacteroidota bacterium]
MLLHSLAAFLLLLLGNTCLSAQNLLPNPGFEDINVCHKYHEECSPKGWRSTTPKLVKFHRFDPSIAPGEAREGLNYMSLLLYDKARPEDRKFIQTELLCPLDSGRWYEFQVHIKSEKFWFAQLDIAFLDSIFFEKKNQPLLGLAPTLGLPIPPSLPANQWVFLSGRFQAKGTERFLLIGNFSPSEQLAIRPLDEKAYRKAKRRYQPKLRLLCSIDQLSLHPSEGEVSNCDLAASRQRIYQDSFRHIAPPPPQLVAIAPPPIDSTPPPPPPPTAPPKLVTGQTIVLNNVNFESGTAQLIPASFPELQNIRQALLQHPNLHILIKGHTDDVGSASDNWLLSRERAKTIYDYLARQGIHKERLSYQGFGETQPIASNDTAAGRQLNRRVELEVR